jgi:seryl-tRNA synthetase
MGNELSISEIYTFISKIVEEKVADIKVGREEFDKLVIEVRSLSEIVAALGEAQKRTEERLNLLTASVNELAEAQKRTEERVNELAEAQKRTEERLAVLTDRLDNLTVQVSNLSTQVGALSENVGFGLEDIARVVVPGWLERHENIHVDDLERKFFDGIEVNLYGEGRKNDSKIIILGEVKSRIYDRDVLKFVDILKTVESEYETYRLMFGYFIHPSAEQIADIHKIKLIASYMR